MEHRLRLDEIMTTWKQLNSRMLKMNSEIETRFTERVLRSLIPGPYRDEIVRDFLISNKVRFVRRANSPVGCQELHGFGVKLGDIFIGYVSDKDGSKFVCRYAPTCNNSKGDNDD